jgi:SOS-response transcriptional repressor LexA
MLSTELRKILRYVHRYCREKGYSPSYKEIAGAVGLRSVAHVQYRIDKLEALGYVTRQPKMARSVRVVRLPGGIPVPDGLVRLPGRIRAWVRDRAAALWRWIAACWRTLRDRVLLAWGHAKLWLRRQWIRFRNRF